MLSCCYFRLAERISICKRPRLQHLRTRAEVRNTTTMSDNVSGKKRRRDEEVLSGDDEEWAESVGSNDRLEGADDLSDEGSFQDEPPAKTRKAKVEGADDLSDEGSFEDEPPPKRKVRKLSMKKTQDFNEKLRRRGVLYVARIPPRMGPAKIKTLLSDFGTVTRVYLVEEDKSTRKRRRKLAGASGAGGKRYREGWVEFEKKSVAKLVGERLNNSPITNQKRSVHYGDLWNVKYLRKFKWEHLTEKVAYERRVREQKMRIEMMQARRENVAYAEKVERGNVMDRIEERRKKKGKKDDHNYGNNNKSNRQFKQTAAFDESQSGPAKPAVLSSLV